jgi:adenosine deaminase
VAEQIALTVCPLSNIKLRLFPDLEHHNLKRLLARGLLVTVNSDDPAYFGGYIAENYAATAAALGLSADDLVSLARNSFNASFLSQEQKRTYLDELSDVAAQASLKTIS